MMANESLYIDALNERLLRNARKSLFSFTVATMATFAPAQYHRHYYDALSDFADSKIKKLMVFMPPQHGKSEGSTRRLPAYILGRDPNRKVAIVSYSATKSKKFNREIQRIICSSEYGEIFPKTKLNSGANISGSFSQNTDECEIVGYRGGFKTVGVGGPLTGDPVDMLIMDDIYKDAKSAWSPTVRENVNDWYDTVAETRLHNDSQQLIVFTRWHQDDLAGKLLREQGIYSEENPNGWVVIIYQAIKEGAPTKYDERNEGEALWPEKHSLEKLQSVRDRSNHVFQSLYQQNPKPLEGLMYENGFKTYLAIPNSKRRIIKNYTDTADTGKDYLFSVTYLETEMYNYILDVIYTQRPMEYTEPKTAEMLTKHMVEICNIESNNGGRSFARAVEDQCRLMDNNMTRINWFFQSENKQVRIFTNSAAVQNICLFPIGWDKMWPELYRDLNNYMKVGNNSHDDAPDGLTGTVEMRGKDFSGLSASDIINLI